VLVESDVVTSALLGLMGVGIPALLIHDSLVAYRWHTGFDITVE
jgi:hypothetical protein